VSAGAGIAGVPMGPASTAVARLRAELMSHESFVEHAREIDELRHKLHIYEVEIARYRSALENIANGAARAFHALHPGSQKSGEPPIPS
jgi:hypothetical protein